MTVSPFGDGISGGSEMAARRLLKKPVDVSTTVLAAHQVVKRFTTWIMVRLPSRPAREAFEDLWLVGMGALFTAA
ncbi:hypothetical protein ACFYO2_49460 [Streptomyces sp. NPDC006602]|uniref:hypothetical protein n=1 Tax=Streptomyces sp. NPDC006602 TaxID=3364751 RepID=UPI0036B449BA